MVEILKAKKPQTKPDLTKQPAANGPSDDMVLVFAGKIMEQEALVRMQRNKLKTINQQAKNAGITLKRLERAKVAAEGDGLEGLIKEFNETARYTGILMGTPLGEQMEFFANPTNKKGGSQEDLMYAAFHKGRVLGLLNKDLDEQAYPSNTDIGQEHLRGWTEGDEQRKLQDKLVENSEVAAAEAKRKAAKKKLDDAEATAKKKADKVAKRASSPKGKTEALVRQQVEDLDADKVVIDTKH